MPQRGDQHAERRRRLPPARVIEMKARERRAPIGQSANQSACSDMLTHTVLRHEGQAVTGKRGADGHRRGIEHQPSLDAHAEFAAPFLELPGMEAAGKVHGNRNDFRSARSKDVSASGRKTT